MTKAATKEKLAADRQDWPVVAFGDIAQMVSERVDPGETELEVYVGLEHLDPESLKIRRHGTPEDVSGQKLKFYEGDIIFGKRRAYQRKLAVAHCDGICSAHAMVLRARPKVVLPEFLPFLMTSDLFMERAVAISVGSLSPTINWKTLKVQEFPLPPVDEQRRIAQLLWAADEVVERWRKTELRLAKTHAVTRDKLFTKGLGGSGSKETKAGLVPDGWQVFQLEKVTMSGTQNGLYKPKRCYGSGPEMVHMGELFGNRYLSNADMQRVEVTDRELAQFGLREGDVMFARRSIVLEGAGQASLVCDLDQPMTFESSIIRITPDQEKILPRFLFNWLESRQGKRVMRRNIRWGAVAGVTGTDVAAMYVPVPPLAVQQVICDKLSDIERQFGRIAATIEAAVNLQKQLASISIGSSGAIT